MDVNIKKVLEESSIVLPFSFVSIITIISQQVAASSITKNDDSTSIPPTTTTKGNCEVKIYRG